MTTTAHAAGRVRVSHRCRPPIRALVPACPGWSAVPPSSPLARPRSSAIMVDEWGPFDWLSPKLWPLDSLAFRSAPPGGAGPSRIVAPGEPARG